MIQDIEPKVYNCDFIKRYPNVKDILVYVEGRNLLMKKVGDKYVFPTFEDTYIGGLFDADGNMTSDIWKNQVRTKYPEMGLFRTVAIDDEAYYIVDTDEIFNKNNGLELVSNEILRHYKPLYMAFGVVTAAQIARWQSNNKYCGRCGSKMRPSDSERAMVCSECKNMVFPKICPAVTISIIHEDKLLLVRNKNSVFHRYAQVAGYVEIGEAFEDTVKREALEETGLKVKNVRYYKNQPWAMTDAQMIGFFAEVDGLSEVKIQEEELLEARWFSADEIPPDIADRSLTYEMIRKFRDEHIGKTGETGRYKEFYELFDTGKNNINIKN